MGKKPADSLDTIQWTEVDVQIDDLKPYEKNPRTMTQTQYEKLLESIQKFGQFRPVLVNKDLTLAGGHQRLKIFKTLGWTRLRASVPSRQLTEAEFKEVLIRDNVNNCTWSQDIMNFDLTPVELKNFGVELKFTPSAAPGSSSDPKKTIIQYNIVFDDEAQQRRWFDFIRWLRDQYSNTETVAQRLDAHLKQTLGHE